MRQVRNRPVPILKIKSIEKLLGLLRADLHQRLAHRQRRPRVLRHRIRQHLRLRAVDSVDFGRAFSAGLRFGLQFDVGVSARSGAAAGEDITRTRIQPSPMLESGPGIRLVLLVRMSHHRFAPQPPWRPLRTSWRARSALRERFSAASHDNALIPKDIAFRRTHAH